MDIYIYIYLYHSVVSGESVRIIVKIKLQGKWTLLYYVNTD